MKDIPIKYIQERIELLQESKAYEDNLWGGGRKDILYHLICQFQN